MVQSFPWGLLDPFQVLLLQGLLKVQGELVGVQEELVEVQVQLKEGNRGWAAVAGLGRRAAGRSRIVTLIMAEHQVER